MMILDRRNLLVGVTVLCALVALKSSTQEGYSSITIIERRQLFNLKEFSDPKSVTLRKEHTQAHPQPYLASAGPACNLLGHKMASQKRYLMDQNPCTTPLLKISTSPTFN